MPTPSTTERAALTGRLEAIPLFDLCQFLLINRRTGTLTVQSRDHIVRIYFKDGMMLDIADEALRSGESVLQAAVQWTVGTFSFDPTPPSVERKLTESTEAILLEAARVIDEQRARGSSGPPQESREKDLRERQAFAGELAETFRRAVELDRRTQSSRQTIETLFRDLARLKGTVVLRRDRGVFRSPLGVQTYAPGFRPEDLIAHAGVEAAGEGVTECRFRYEQQGWFHLRVRRSQNDSQVYLAALDPRPVAPDAYGVDAEALAPYLSFDEGLVLWSGRTGGLRSAALASLLAATAGRTNGVRLLLEESPRVAWEEIDAGCLHCGDPAAPENDTSLLLEWKPDLVVIDSVRTEQAAASAAFLAAAGLPTVAVTSGVVPSESLLGLLDFLRGSMGERAGPVLASTLRAVVNVIPVTGKGGNETLLVAQAVTIDAGLQAALAAGGHEAEIRAWAEAGAPARTFSDDLERLIQAGRIDPGREDGLRSVLADLRL